MQKASLVTSCIFVLATCASGLTMQQQQQQSPWDPDVSSFLDQPIRVSGNSLLQESGGDMFLRSRAARTQNLLTADHAAVIAQQKAIEQVAAEQASLAQHQQELKLREDKVDAGMAHALAAFDVILSQTVESSSAGIRVRSRIRAAGDWLQKNWKKQLIGAAVWAAITIGFGAVYATCLTYGYSQLRKEPIVTREGFSFGLCDGYSCDPDTRVCCSSHFCLPVRWADTASSPKIGFITFWAGLIIFTIFAALNSFSYGISGLVCLVLSVCNRQHIRARYGMPNGKFSTIAVDIAVWCCCIPCAAMQEALEVEFIDPPGMTPRNSMSTPQQSMGMGSPRMSDASFLDHDRFLANQGQNTCC